jgi:hypothetical protein
MTGSLDDVAVSWPMLGCTQCTRLVAVVNAESSLITSVRSV